LSKPRKDLKEDVLKSVPEGTTFFTRDVPGALMLLLFGFKFKYEERTGGSGTDVRGKIYEEIRTGKPTGWEHEVTPRAKEVIRSDETWSRLEYLCKVPDQTLHLGGFKVPLKGLFE
jgi:hypothetical protein